MAMGTVTLGTGTVVSQHPGHLGRGAMTLEDPLQHLIQIGERNGLHFGQGGVELGHAEAPIELLLWL
ncbi:hypothetical protein D3C78_1641460 [compost metagenome]